MKSRSRHCSWFAVAAAAVCSVTPWAGCGGAQVTPSQTVLIHDQRPPVRTSFGALNLGMTLADARQVAVTGGWGVQGPWVADGQVELAPSSSDPVKRYKITLEAGVVVQLWLERRVADPSLSDMRLDYPARRVHPDGTWAMTDQSRQTLVLVHGGKGTIWATYLSRVRDQASAQSLLRRYIDGRKGSE